MKNIRVFLSENFQFFEVKFSIYLNRHVFVMDVMDRLSPLSSLPVLVRILSQETNNCPS